MTDLVMPKFGLTMTEGLLSEWRVSVGDRFAAGDLLFTVETEKVVNEVEAEQDGVIDAILAPAGSTVPVGAAIARFVNSDESASSASVARFPARPQSQTQQALAAPEQAARDRSGGTAPSPLAHNGEIKADATRIVATPLARRLALERGIDLRKIVGTGPKGRIKSDDLRHAPAIHAPIDAVGSGRRLKPDANRLATAQRVRAAKSEIPHFYLTMEVEVSALRALRDELNVDLRERKISVTHMLIKGMALALAENPAMNAVWLDDEILAFDSVDIGLVTETPMGVRIPVIRNAAEAPLDRLAAATTDLLERTRSGALRAGDVGGAAMSLSNVGMFGVGALTPIINPPNAMILGVGAEKQLFRPDDLGSPSLRRELTLTLACDHRIIDGAEAARFLTHLVGTLEKPLRLLRPAGKAISPERF
ncbi:MAG: 2-oxo acid dehydrogenase subunit E2 [Rhizobiales bacterium]|nr:2-oxo acid dehydrogenase subunit E2 [Hyphomicrobiales bacterium]